MVELTELDGVAEGRAENLREKGYESVEDLADADPEAVADEVSYVPEDTALDLVVQSQNIVAEEDAEVEEEEPTSVTEEVSEAVEEESEPEESDDELVEEAEKVVQEAEEEVGEREVETSNAGSEVDSPSAPENESIEFEITFNDELEFDTLFDSVMGQRATMLRSNRDGVDAFDHALDQMRASPGIGSTVEFKMDEDQLNDLHNTVRQTMIAYKGDNLIDHMDALKRVLNRINEVREENLF